MLLQSSPDFLIFQDIILIIMNSEDFDWSFIKQLLLKELHSETYNFPHINCILSIQLK